MSTMNEDQVDAVEAMLGSAFEPSDQERKITGIVESVTINDGQYTLSFDRGMTFGWKVSDMDDHLRFQADTYMPQVGHDIVVHETVNSINGVYIDGQRIFHRSEREVNLRWLMYRAERQRHRHQEWLDSREELEARVQALPGLFKARIARFRRNNPDFDRDFLAYELLAVEDAVKISDFCHAVAAGTEVRNGAPILGQVDRWYDTSPTTYTGEKIHIHEDTPSRVLIWFKELDYKLQREYVDLNEGHSGNSFGMACFIALAALQSPEHVVKIHGALSSLVGSDKYGDIDPVTGEPGGWEDEVVGV